MDADGGQPIDYELADVPHESAADRIKHYYDI